MVSVVNKCSRAKILTNRFHAKPLTGGISPQGLEKSPYLLLVVK